MKLFRKEFSRDSGSHKKVEGVIIPKGVFGKEITSKCDLRGKVLVEYERGMQFSEHCVSCGRTWELSLT